MEYHPLVKSPRSDALSHSQEARRNALLNLSDATHTGIFKRAEGGRLDMTKRGIVAAAWVASVAYYITRLVMRDRLSRFKWYQLLQIKDGRKQIFESYILSIINASIICGYSGYKVLLSRNASTRGATRMLATCLGYFCHDTFMMRHTLSSDAGLLFHHVFGIVIVSSVMLSPSWPSEGVKKFIPAVGTIELSTVFLSAMWLLKETGQTKGQIYKATLGLFVTSFFFTRIIGLNLQLRKMWDDVDFEKLGIARYMLLGLSALNLYWFKKIVAMAIKG